MAYVGAIDDVMVHETVKAMQAAAAIKLSDLPDDASRKRSALLFSLFAQLWKTRATVLLRMIEPSNGYEATRRMESKIKEEAPGKELATSQGVLNIDFSRFTDMLKAIDKFEMLCDKHESATSSILEDSISS
jgi:hypothetical protein